MLGVDEVLRGGRMGYYIGLMGLIRLMGRIVQIRQLGTNRAIRLIK